MRDKQKKWTEEELDQVEAMVRGKLTSSVIAERMGVSRHSIIGCVHRHIQKRGAFLAGATPTRVASAARVAVEKEKKREKLMPPLPPARIVVTPIPPLIPKERPKVVQEMHYLPLTELSSNACRFPVEVNNGVVGGYLFCAQVKIGESSYCEHHRALCTTSSILRTRTKVGGIASWPK